MQAWINYGFPTRIMVDRMSHFVGYALPDAPCATNQAPYPIVLCSPMGAGPRAYWAEKAAHLASHGYVVASMDHHDVVGTVFPDGTYLKGDSSGDFNAATLHDRVRDLVFVLDEVTRWSTNDAVFAGRLDLTKVATLGGCCGYEAAAEFCRNDPRCRAAILVLCHSTAHWGCVTSVPDLDQFGVGKPFLGVYSEVNTAYTWLFDKAAKDATVFRILGTGEVPKAGMILVGDFYWFQTPDFLALGREASRTIADYGLWFLNKYLKHSTDPMPALADYPRVTGFMQK